MRFPVLLVILSLTLSGCLGFFERTSPLRGLSPEEAATQRREAEAADALGQAMQLSHNGSYLDDQAARELLDKAIELDPTLTTAWYQRAELNWRQNRREEAFTDTRQVIRLDPRHADGQNLYGLLLFHRGDYKGAAKAFDKALTLDDSRADSYGLRGAAHARLGDSKAALQDFTEAIARNPAYREAYYNRGLINFRLGNDEAALHDLTQALSLNANSVDTLLARASVHTKLKEYEQAVTDYSRAIALSPNDTRIIGLLADTYGTAGKYREAEAAAHRAMLMARQEGDLETSRRFANKADAFAAMSADLPAP